MRKIKKILALTVQKSNSINNSKNMKTNNSEDMKIFHLQVGDRVNHIKETDEIIGTILQIDWNLIHLGYGVTTCSVLWNDCTEAETAWTNKLVKVETKSV